MECRAGKIGWLGVLVSWLAAGVSELPAQTMKPDMAPSAITAPAENSFAPARVALEDMPAAVRDKVRAVMEKATLVGRGPVEVFTCQPAMYYWLLDNPDQAVRLWRLIGAKCTDIDREPNNRFRWHDAQGSNLHWDTVLRTGTQRVWFAEGKVNPGVLLPMVDVQAVVVLNHIEGTDAAGKTAIRHQIDLYLKTDGRAMSIATKLFGASSPRVAEQHIGQIEMFYAALSWYLDQHPEKATELFKELRP
jgi:hypothetical protein